jgi:hypothetical protein
MDVVQVPTQHLGAASALQAHDIIGPHRLPDRHCRGSLWFQFASFPGGEQRSIDRVDERRNVGWRDLIFLYVTDNKTISATNDWMTGTARSSLIGLSPFSRAASRIGIRQAG